ncbi:MAG: hypothetical protein QOI61_1730 [Actinomycetota bacterium]
MLRLYGGRYDDPAYVERLGPCTELLWDVAVQIVAVGSSVVLDWNFWSRERRSEARQRAEATGADLVVHWIDIPVEEVVERALARAKPGPLHAHEIDAEGVRHLAAIFESPDHAEGFRLERHH